MTDVTCYGAARRVWARRGGFETRPPVFLQDIIGVYQPTSGDVGLRCIKSAVQGFAIVVVEPVAGIQGHQIDLGSFRQISWFIENQTTLLNPRLQSHEETLAPRPHLVHAHTTERMSMPIPVNGGLTRSWNR